MKLRTFLCVRNPVELSVGNVFATPGGLHWRVVDRLADFLIFVLKSELSGEKMLVRAYQHTDLVWYLKEIRDPTLTRRYDNDYYRRKRRGRKRKQKISHTTAA